MLTRRGFAACALCATAGFAATAVNAQTGGTPVGDAPAGGAQAKTPGVARKILQQTDGPIDGFATILVEGTIDAGATVAWHTHPGIESAYIVEGGGDFLIKGRPNRAVRAGDAVQIPTQVPHSFKNGDKPTKVASTYVVEKSHPLSSPASPG